MFRDMMAIGIPMASSTTSRASSPPIPSLNLPLEEGNGAVIKTGDAKTHNAHLMNVLPDLGKHYDMVFTTYNQMQTQEGKDTQRRRFLEGLAMKGGVVMIFDESHNGGGQKQGRKSKGDARIARPSCAAHPEGQRSVLLLGDLRQAS
jgi:hypothetical protein